MTRLRCLQNAQNTPMRKCNCMTHLLHVQGISDSRKDLSLNAQRPEAVGTTPRTHGAKHLRCGDTPSEHAFSFSSQAGVTTPRVQLRKKASSAARTRHRKTRSWSGLKAREGSQKNKLYKTSLSFWHGSPQQQKLHAHAVTA